MARGELPKYRTIADDLRRRIDDGRLTPGERLPSQSAMAADYGVTVMTLRQAIAELERDGLVRAMPGRGTFVSTTPAVSFGLDRLSSFAQEMAQQGVSVATEVLRVDDPSSDDDVEIVRRVADPAMVAGDLVTVARRRRIDSVVVVVQRSTIAVGVWRLIDGVDLRRRSLYDALAEGARIRVERASERFQAITVSGVDAELLEVPEGTAAMESVRVSFDVDGTPFLVDHALMVGAATQLRADRTADDLRLGYATPT